MDWKVKGKDAFNKKKIDLSRKNKKENGIVEEIDNGRGASDREVEDCDIELSKEDKKMKRNKKEKKKKGSDLDFDDGEEGAIDEKDHVEVENKKKKKKRKLEHKKDGDCQKDVESKDAKNWKKENKKELKKHGCCDNGYCNVIESKDAQYKNSHVGGEKSVSNMGMSEYEEPGSAAEFGLTKDEKKRKRKRKKEKWNKYKEDMVPSSVEDREVQKDNGTKGCKSTGKVESSYIKEGEERGSQKKKKKKDVRMDKEDNDIKSLKSKAFDDDMFVEGKSSTTNDKEKNKYKDHANGEACLKEILPKNSKNKRKTLIQNKEVAYNEDHLILSTKKKRDKKKDVFDVDTEKSDDKNKKDMSVKEVEEKKVKGGGRTKRRDEVHDHPWDSQTKKASKRVRFSGHVEVFPSPGVPDLVEEDQKDDLVQGKRFSREEDEMVKDAVSNYIKAHDLGEEGLNMVLHCKSHPEVKTCWKEIGAALPWRPQKSVYYRAHILYERGEKRKWTPEEYDLVRRVHEQHGSNWKMMAEALGKYRVHVKDTWRRIKVPNLKKGHWSQEEYQTLFDLVNKDLRMRVFEEKKSKHGMLRDNIGWGAISDKLSSRSNANCCLKWYDQLTSPMVAEGRWADTDDYRLLNILYSLDASCAEDVDWDNLLEHRSGDDCSKRWNQMVSHLGKHGCKPFAEQVEVLSQRYCPELLEVRETYDSKPIVP